MNIERLSADDESERLRGKDTAVVSILELPDGRTTVHLLSIRDTHCEIQPQTGVPNH